MGKIVTERLQTGGGHIVTERIGGSKAKGRRPTKAELEFLRKHKGDGFGFLNDAVEAAGGVAGNLGGDIASVVTGFPMGVKEQVSAGKHDIEELVARGTHPGGVRRRRKEEFETPKIVEQLMQSYKDYYSHPSNFLEHPLQILLDTATVASLGAGAATKTGLLKIPERRQMLPTPGGGEIPGKVMSQRPLMRGAQVLGEKLPTLRPYRKAALERKRTHETRAAAQRLKAVPYLKSWNKLKPREQVALSILGRVPKVEDLAKWRADLKPDAPIQGVLRDPEIVALYRNPTERMLDAHAKGGALGEEAAGILERLGALTPEAAAERPYLHSRILSGAKFEPEFQRELPDFNGEPPASLFGDEFGKANLEPSGFGVGAWVRANDRPNTAANLGRITSYDPNSEWVTVHFHNRGTQARADVTIHRDQLRLASEGDVGRNIPMVLRGGKDVEELRGEIAGAGRPQPIYMRDTAIKEKTPTSMAGMGAGLGLPKSPVRQSKALLFKSGQMALKPDQISPAYFRTVIYEHKRGLHDSLLKDGIKTPMEEGLHPGNTWVRRPIGEKQQPERIGYMETTKGQFEKETGELKRELDIEDLSDEELAADDFTTDNPDEAAVVNGHRVQIPISYAKEVSGEFRRAGNVEKILLQEPTKFWRALVLNARPAWLVNNIIGNSLLFAMSFAGRDGIKAAVKQAVRRGELDESFVDEFFPEHTKAGTLIGSQSPEAGAFGRAATIMGAGLAPVDKAYEAFLRRSGLEAGLRKNPAVKARLEAMPKETRSLKKAARLELADNPALARQVSQQVMDAMGDYFSMGDFERRFIRSLLPFYGWYRAITTIMLKFPLNHPGRALIATNLGRIGDERSRDGLGPVPSYLRGAIPVGKDSLFKTQGLNPYSTPIALSRGVTEDTGQLGINPILAAAGRTFGKKMPWEDPSSLADFPAEFKKSAIETLPQYRLYKPPPSRLYQDAGRGAELSQYLGWPKRRFNRTRAAQLAREGK